MSVAATDAALSPRAEAACSNSSRSADVIGTRKRSRSVRRRRIKTPAHDRDAARMRHDRAPRCSNVARDTAAIADVAQHRVYPDRVSGILFPQCGPSQDAGTKSGAATPSRGLQPSSCSPMMSERLRSCQWPFAACIHAPCCARWGSALFKRGVRRFVASF
jgi:hypothetical protein